MRSEDDGVAKPVHRWGVGPVRRRVYERNPKHGLFDRGRVSRLPANGQGALDCSVPVPPTPKQRVGVDYDDCAFAVLRFHDFGEFRDSLNFEIFHGYAVDWRGLTQHQKNALMRWGLANLKGRIQ